jgi:hypothetical protein
MAGVSEFGVGFKAERAVLMGDGGYIVHKSPCGHVGEPLEIPSRAPIWDGNDTTHW